MTRPSFGKITAELTEALRSIVGTPNVLVDRDALEKYSRDEMVGAGVHCPDVVVMPRDTDAVASVMRLASEMRLPVTPRGAGTGLSGGCVPLYGGIVLSLERMGRIIEIDVGNLVATVEPGVTVDKLAGAAEALGLYFPLYPGEKTATIGGNVATNAGGMRAVKYGVTRNFVLGLEAVLPSGDIITSGGKFVKCSTGYDLTRLLVGSEGTLAVVTKTLVRLMLAPGKREVLLVPFKTLEAAIGTVPAILRAGIIPAGIEFLQRDIVVLVEKYTGREFPLRDNEAFLMILVESADERSLMEELNLIGETCRRSGAVDVYIPPSERARRHLLEMREKFYPTVRTLPNVQIADVVVPRSRIAEFVTGVKETAARLGVAVLAYGHAGDGNVHIHPYSPVSDGAAGKRNQARLFDEIYRLGAAMGGAASGEHGLGYDKKKYLVVSYSPETVAMMKRIKQAFDPLGILNPGKVFP